jgi:hypothetical protein
VPPILAFLIFIPIGYLVTLIILVHDPDDGSTHVYLVAHALVVSYAPHFAQPVPDKSRRFLNLSTGALVGVITAILLACCVGPIAFCFMSPFLAAIGDAATPEPTIQVTSCSVDTGSARVGYRLTNNSASSASFVVSVEIRDASGARVGNGSDYVSTISAGGSANEEALVIVTSSGGVTCHVSHS